LYVVSERYEDDYLDSVEVYSPITNTWAILENAPKNAPRINAMNAPWDFAGVLVVAINRPPNF